MTNEPALQALVARVNAARASGTPLAIEGGGTKRFYGEAPAGERLDTRALAGISSYEPTELVVTARAGTPLAELEAAGGQARELAERLEAAGRQVAQLKSAGETSRAEAQRRAASEAETQAKALAQQLADARAESQAALRQLHLQQAEFEALQHQHAEVVQGQQGAGRRRRQARRAQALEPRIALDAHHRAGAKLDFTADGTRYRSGSQCSATSGGPHSHAPREA